MAEFFNTRWSNQFGDGSFTQDDLAWPGRRCDADRVRGVRAVDHGAPAVAVVSLTDARRLRRQDRIIKKRSAVAEAFRSVFAGIPDEELEQEIDKSLAEVKEDIRREREVQPADATRREVASKVG